MPTDIKLDQGDGNEVLVEGNLVVTGDIRTGSIASIGGAITELKDALANLQANVGSSASRRLDALENTVTQLAEMIGAVVIPQWSTKTEVEEGDDMGLSIFSADDLGLVIEFQFDRLKPNFGHEDVISITPPAGTLVKKGSTVVVELNLLG